MHASGQGTLPLESHPPTDDAVHADPRRYARITGALYLLVFVFGITALNASGGARTTANLVGAALYYAVTLMLYRLYKPVTRTGSLVTAAFSLTAVTLGVFRDVGVLSLPFNTLVLFGAYCIGLGVLTIRSTFLPRVIGVLLVVAGLGWLTWVHPPFARSLGPWAMAPGMIGEGVLTLWLLAVGVDPDRWRAQPGRP